VIYGTDNGNFKRALKVMYKLDSDMFDWSLDKQVEMIHVSNDEWASIVASLQQSSLKLPLSDREGLSAFTIGFLDRHF